MNWEGIEFGKIMRYGGMKSSPRGISRNREKGMNLITSLFTSLAFLASK